ncbi:class E sortase [Dethiobacter alkaliphilus]|uniref:Sortase family protein n=1 Tax=Dethiobacter alkaliphilus AHT 1 TaxID=555088 RepID=C0GEQ3_DETAL|nr:sortase [Dethiobacter alkaliphilus]EEG78085.1 sortase family protein [Dethiobacter alkaliphilus AHT 1]
MKRAINIFSVLLIFSGLALVATPIYRYAVGIYYQSAERAAMVGEAPEYEPVKSIDPVVLQEEMEVDPTKLPQFNGVLEIPNIDLDVVVVQGVSQEDLRRGVGFYPQSTHPEYGNVSIAGHRTGYAGWFLKIDRLEPGDEIILTLGPNRYHYSVRKQFITHNRDWDVIESNGNAELTLTTCLMTTNSRRLIVKADLVEVIEVQQETREIQ